MATVTCQQQQITSGMNRCHTCRNNRRQLLMLKCSHDTCIKCAADNYFINCKNKPGSKKPRSNLYYCEKCLEQTELDANTIQTLRKYFMDNVTIDDNNKNDRRQKLAERQMLERERLQRVARLDHENTQRPKSLQIEIADRKRTLSKYLNQKQVEKFIQMQNEYGSRGKIDSRPKQQPRATPQQHLGLTPQPHPYNQYELAQGEKRKELQHKERKSINDSFEKFAQQQRFSNHNDYMRAENAGRARNSQRPNANESQDVEYEIYHNGKGVVNPQLRAAERLLDEERQAKTSSRPSSNSSNKVIGTIRSKRSPNKPDPSSPLPQDPPRNSAPGMLIKKQRVTSCKSEDNLEQLRNGVVKQVNAEYNTRQGQNTQDGWEMESKSTKRQEKTIQMGQRNSLDTVDKILDTFEASQPHRSPETIQQLKEKSTIRERSMENKLLGEKSRWASPERTERVEVYFCKIHEDEEIIYFCLKCNQLICSECALHGSHRSHEIHSLKKSALLLRQRLAHSTSTLTKLLIQEESKQKILRECLHQISLECSRQKEQVRSSFQNFIFHVDKKYKELLKEVEDRFALLLTDYTDKLTESRNNYIQVSKVKDSVCDTLQACAGAEEGTVSETSIGAACNQFGNFNVKRPRTRPTASPWGIETINRLTSSIRELEEFLKTSNILLFSNKKESLLSENSSLRLSQSSNLLQEMKDNGQTPETATPQGQSLFKRGSPDKHNKKIVVSSYSLNVKSRIKISHCDCIVQSLLEMQEIVKAIKADSIQYQLKSLQ